MVSVAKIPSLAEICSNWDFPFNNHGMLAMSGQKWKLYQQIWRCTKRNMDFSDIKIYPSELQWIYLNLPHKDGSKSTSGEKKTYVVNRKQSLFGDASSFIHHLGMGQNQ